MITFDFTQMYPSLTAIFLLVTGGLLVFSDVQMYAQRGMIKEKTWARNLGWVNIGLGVLLLIFRWVYLNLFW